jgi:hypothetical protein
MGTGRERAHLDAGKDWRLRDDMKAGTDAEVLNFEGLLL